MKKILEECRENDAKVIIFPEWVRMLELVRELCERLDLGFTWHIGTVPQRHRRAEINAFKTIQLVVCFSARTAAAPA